MWGNIEDGMNYKGAKRQKRWMMYVLWEKKNKKELQTNKHTNNQN